MTGGASLSSRRQVRSFLSRRCGWVRPEVEGDTRIPLPAQCGSAAAEGLHRALCEATDRGAVHIDASQVDSVGQAVLQLLLAARRTAQARGISFDIRSASETFSDTLSRCQLPELLISLPGRSMGE